MALAPAVLAADDGTHIYIPTQCVCSICACCIGMDFKCPAVADWHGQLISHIPIMPLH